MRPDSDLHEGKSLVLFIEILVALVICLLFCMLFFLFILKEPSRFTFISPAIDQPGEIEKTYPTNASESSGFWLAPELSSISGSGLEAQIKYGKDLIAHTAKYLGPKGSVARISNGMNCQNCHLEAGTKIFGNNYGSVFSTYPRFRARSGSTEDIYKRVNDCFERSLNGQPLDNFSPEMQAIKAYLIFLGKQVPKGSNARGSGLKDITFLKRPASPDRGRIAYVQHCSVCHQTNGSGIPGPGSVEYVYPPLWGPGSYNDAAGLYRISNFAKYIKYNMPLGARYDAPILTDDEAWDIAAFVNSMPRPHMSVPADWPDISKKPIDHPFGPYADTFSINQHKYGPFIVMK